VSLLGPDVLLFVLSINLLDLFLSFSLIHTQNADLLCIFLFFLFFPYFLFIFFLFFSSSLFLKLSPLLKLSLLFHFLLFFCFFILYKFFSIYLFWLRDLDLRSFLLFLKVLLAFFCKILGRPFIIVISIIKVVFDLDATLLEKSLT
jgi:hypothetical protein